MTEAAARFRPLDLPFSETLGSSALLSDVRLTFRSSPARPRQYRSLRKVAETARRTPGSLSRRGVRARCLSLSTTVTRVPLGRVRNDILRAARRSRASSGVQTGCVPVLRITLPEIAPDAQVRAHLFLPADTCDVRRPSKSRATARDEQGTSVTALGTSAPAGCARSRQGGLSSGTDFSGQVISNRPCRPQQAPAFSPLPRPRRSMPQSSASAQLWTRRS